jgi:hypothetical protein
MNASRIGHSATVLSDGTVLVAGGHVDREAGAATDVLASAERYDPGSGS